MISRTLTLAVLATALAASPALAAEYTVDACRHADGTPAPMDGWAFAVTDDGTGNIAADSCAQGGHVDLALGAGTHGKAGGPASVLLTRALPSGASWTRAQVWLAYKASPVTPAQDPHKVALTIAGTMPCAWGAGAGCSMFGSFSAPPLSAVNQITATPTAPGQPLQLGVMCDSPAGLCPATSGDPYAAVRVWRVAVTVNDPTTSTAPPGTDPGAPTPVPAATAGAALGSLTVRLRRLGARRVRLSGRLLDRDGEPVGRARLVLRRQVKGRPTVFSRLVTRRDGRFSKVLRRGKRPAGVSVRWIGLSSRTLLISPR